MGENKQFNIETYMEFNDKANTLFSKISKESSVSLNLVKKVESAKEYWLSLTNEATCEELKERLENLESWCRYWNQQLIDQVPLGINMEKAQIQSNWHKVYINYFVEFKMT